MKIITLSSWKGGVGKTTLTIAAITTLAKKGKNVLVIDLDSNLAMTRRFKKVDSSKNSIDFINGDFTGLDDVHATEFPGIFLIASDLRISKMANLSENTITYMLEKFDLTGIDYVFIDPPGTMNALTRTAMATADKIIIPAMPSAIDFEATGLVFEELGMMGVEADISVVLNGWDTKRNVNGIKKEFHSKYDEFMYSHEISAMKSLKSLTADVFNYKLNGKAREIIDRFVSEVVE